MGFGLQVFDESGRLTYDSNEATGGVCLGYFTIPAKSYGDSTVLTFPEIGPDRVGFMLNPTQNLFGTFETYTFDNALGYPRFTFPGSPYTHNVLLFIK